MAVALEFNKCGAQRRDASATTGWIAELLRSSRRLKIGAVIEQYALLRYSAPVSFTMRSKSVRGISLSIWLNMLHDAFTLGLLRLRFGGFGHSPIPYTQGFPNVISCLGQEWALLVKSANMNTPNQSSPRTLGPLRRIAGTALRHPQKLRDEIRFQGLLGTLWHLAIEALAPYGRLELALLYAFDLKRTVPSALARAPLTVEQASARETSEIATVMHCDTNDVQNAIASGELCFVARGDGRIVHTNWITFGRKRSLAGRYIVLPPDCAYCNSGFTVEAWRGLGVHMQVNSHMLQYLKARGMRHAYSYVAAENRSSLKTLQRLNWQRTGVMLAYTPRRNSVARIWRLAGRLEPFAYEG
jgi:hypothetical protein